MTRKKFDPDAAFKSIVSTTEVLAVQEPEPIEKVQGLPVQGIQLVTPKQKEETRNKRVNLLVTPSLHKQAEKRCKKMGISLNECVNQLLESWCQSQK